MTGLAIILWRGHLNVWVSAAVLFALGVWLWAVWRRLLTRATPGRAALLLTPKVLVAVLLLAALFEPVWSREQRDPSKNRLIALVDVSASMDVADDGREPRLARARKILERIQENLPEDVTLETVEFDTALHTAGGAPGGRALPASRDTDLAGSIVTLAERGGAGAALGTVVLTDGGDEKVLPAKWPGAPTSFIGIGTEPNRWDDVALADVTAPATVEKEVAFEIAVDVTARAGGGGGFGERLRNVPVILEEERAGAWVKTQEQPLDLSRYRARATFAVTGVEPGLRRYRVSAASVPGEVSFLNNGRTLLVDVQKKSVHVLYFTRELGMDFKMLRGELARDPGISFTALFRTVSERFTVQGDRLAGDEELAAGFPTSEQTLRLYDAVVLGSFPASDWNAAQMAALVKYVEDGGAVVWLGGEKSFGRGGYAGTVLAPLFPWDLAAEEPALATGQFPVNVPAPAAGQAALAGVRESLDRGAATIESLNAVGALKPGALAWLQANVGTRLVPLVAAQAFGKGKALAVASNTLWKWATHGEDLATAYGRFWRQAMRDLTGKSEGGRVVSVRWDKDSYRPGESAVAEIRVAGEQAAKEARLTATLTFAGQTTPVEIELAPGQPGTFTARVQFRDRGEYAFRLVVYQGDQVAETYEKVLPVAPLLAEGAHLELDADHLRKLAEKGGGTFAREADASEFVKKLAGGVWQKTVVIERPLAEHGPWYAGILLLALVLEWVLRRRMNLF